MLRDLCDAVKQFYACLTQCEGFSWIALCVGHAVPASAGMIPEVSQLASADSLSESFQFSATNIFLMRVRHCRVI